MSMDLFHIRVRIILFIHQLLTPKALFHPSWVQNSMNMPKNCFQGTLSQQEARKRPQTILQFLRQHLPNAATSKKTNGKFMNLWSDASLQHLLERRNGKRWQ